MQCRCRHLLLLLLGGVVRPSVCLSVCLSVVCHTRAPAKAVGRNEMPFSRYTVVAQSDILLDRGLSPPYRILPYLTFGADSC